MPATKSLGIVLVAWLVASPQRSAPTRILSSAAAARRHCGPTRARDLPDRRAEAAKRFLVEKFSLPPQSLVAIGYGEEQLKNPADPAAAENRRVQVVNLASP